MAPMQASSDKKSLPPLLRLPPELRLHIYEHILSQEGLRGIDFFVGLSALWICRLVRNELQAFMVQHTQQDIITTQANIMEADAAFSLDKEGTVCLLRQGENLSPLDTKVREGHRFASLEEEGDLLCMQR